VTKVVTKDGIQFLVYNDVVYFSDKTFYISHTRHGYTGEETALVIWGDKNPSMNLPWGSENFYTLKGDHRHMIGSGLLEWITYVVENQQSLTSHSQLVKELQPRGEMA
jgi:hypothetical protein